MYLFAMTVNVEGKKLGYIVQAENHAQAKAILAALHPGIEPTIQDLAKNVIPRVFKTYYEAQA